jgi:hypothetical protein
MKNGPVLIVDQARIGVAEWASDLSRKSDSSENVAPIPIGGHAYYARPALRSAKQFALSKRREETARRLSDELLRNSRQLWQPRKRHT